MLTINGLLEKLKAAGIKGAPGKDGTFTELTAQALRGRVALDLVTKPFDADKVTRGRTAFYPNSAFPDNYAVAKLLYFQGNRLTSEFVKEIKTIATAYVTGKKCLIDGISREPCEYYPTGNEQKDIPFDLAKYFIAYYVLAYINTVDNVAVKINFFKKKGDNDVIIYGMDSYLACTADYEPQLSPMNCFNVKIYVPDGFESIDYHDYSVFGLDQDRLPDTTIDYDRIILPKKIQCDIIL